MSNMNFFQLSIMKDSTKLIIVLIFLIVTLGIFSTFISLPYTLVFILLVTLFIIVCAKPQWGLYILIFTVPPNIGYFQFDNKLASPHLLETACSIPLDWGLLLVIIFAWLVRKASRPDYNKGPNHPSEIIYTDLLVILVLWNALTLFWTPNVFVGFIQYIKLLTNICIFYLFYHGINSRNSLRQITWAWLILGLILFIFSFISIYGQELAVNINQDRFITFWKYRFDLSELMVLDISWRGHLTRGTALMSFNSLPFLLNLIIAFGIGLILSTKKEETRKRFLLKTILLVLTCAHMTSLSKGGIIGLFAMMFFFLVTNSRLRRNFIKNSLLVVSSISILFVLVRIMSLLQSYSRIAGSTEAFSAPTRLAWWSEILGLLFQKTFGLGLGIGASMFYLDPVPYIHSIYFSILSDMGWIGFLLFMIFIFVVVKEIRPIIKHQETFLQNMLLAFSGAMVAIGVHGLVDFHYNYTVIWMFMGFGLAILRMAKQELVSKELLLTS